MRMLIFGVAAAMLAGGASAQILNAPGAAGATVGATVGGAGHVVDGAAGATTRNLDRTTDSAAHATSGRSVTVGAGASVRVNRGTRCYYENNYYDPTYRDGAYYCEQRSSGVGVAAGAKAR